MTVETLALVLALYLAYVVAGALLAIGIVALYTHFTGRESAPLLGESERESSAVIYSFEMGKRRRQNTRPAA